MQYYKTTKRDDDAYWARIRDRVVHRGDCATPFHKVTHRERGTIPGCVPAYDIYSFNEDPDRDPDRLYMTIKNPSKPSRPNYFV